MYSRLSRLRRGLALALCLVLAGCLGLREARDNPPPDERYGHRYDGPDPMGRPTLPVPAPLPADSLDAYFIYPASIDSVHIRPGPFDPDLPADVQSVPVEVLVKGLFPDPCITLHTLEQERLGPLVNVTLKVRRPRQAACPSEVTPYRLYFTLDGLYRAGTYQLRLNGGVRPFQVRAPEEEA